MGDEDNIFSLQPIKGKAPVARSYADTTSNRIRFPPSSSQPKATPVDLSSSQDAPKVKKSKSKKAQLDLGTVEEASSSQAKAKAKKASRKQTYTEISESSDLEVVSQEPARSKKKRLVILIKALIEIC